MSASPSAETVDLSLEAENPQGALGLRRLDDDTTARVLGLLA